MDLRSETLDIVGGGAAVFFDQFHQAAPHCLETVECRIRRIDGLLAIFAVCIHPFLQLGVQYLLYKFTAFLSGVIGPPGLCKLIDGLGSAFGLVLGMTGACALLLLVSVLASVAAVVP